jgi:hypothetical protein
MGQPGAPAPLNTHTRDHLGHAERNAADRQREKHRTQIEHRGGVTLLDGVEDRAIPDVDAVLKADIGNERDQGAV